MSSGAYPMVFVAMPFGKKRDPRTNVEIDFDAIYRDGIQPAIAQLTKKKLKVELIRADEERGGGIVHKPMFERLLVAQIAIVDVTVENANVFYELGVRHAVRPHATIVMRAKGVQMPFDIKMIHAVTYELNQGALGKAAATALAAALAAEVEHALRDDADRSDSPVFQLIPKYRAPHIPDDLTDLFRERIHAVNDLRERLQHATSLPDKAKGNAAIGKLAAELGPVTTFNAESAVDIVLAYRGVGAWPEMIAFIERMPRSQRERNVIVREQYALALNRRGTGSDRSRALRMLEAIVAERGANPETCGLIGRIFKDRYNAQLAAEDLDAAHGSLERAIHWYQAGFVADPRAYYPGINLLTLLVVRNDPDEREEMRRVAAAVSFALDRIGAIDSRDYWDVATCVEAAVHENDWERVNKAMRRLLTLDLVLDYLRSTRDNLKLIAAAKLPHIDPAELAQLIVRFDTRVAALDGSRKRS